MDTEAGRQRDGVGRATEETEVGREKQNKEKEDRGQVKVQNQQVARDKAGTETHIYNPRY